MLLNEIKCTNGNIIYIYHNRIEYAGIAYVGYSVNQIKQKFNLKFNK